MDLAAVVVLRAGGSGTGDPLKQAAVAARAALAAGCDPTVVVVGDPRNAEALPSEATVLQDEARPPSEASALRVGVDWCVKAGASRVLLSLGAADPNHLVPRFLARLAPPGVEAIVLAMLEGQPCGLAAIDGRAFGLLPIGGAASGLWERHPELVSELALEAGPDDSPEAPADAGGDADLAAVTALLGRPPAGSFRVVVRRSSGEPVVIENAPFLDDGTPMPTRYWLVGNREREAVGRLESGGEIARAEAAIGLDTIAEAHERYATERDAAIPAGHAGPRPSGGVGGTRQGVKCLHAHLAWYLAGGHDPVGRHVTRLLEGVLEGPVAAVDCGTNSTRLLVLDRAGSPLTRKMTITRLGEGVDQTGKLSADAIARTISVLRAYREEFEGRGVVRVRAVATSAARDAANAEEFFAAAEEALGVRPQLLTGDEEGRLAYLGATSSLDASEGPFLVADIGGGSTELIAGPTTAAGAPAAVISLDVGCVRITERFLASDPPIPDELEGARRHVRELVQGALARLPELGVPRRLVGVAGTVSALAHLALGLDHHDPEIAHRSILSRPSIEALLSSLASEPVAARRNRRGLEPARADVIVGGALVLAELLAVLGHEELICSEADILDGIAAELARSVAHETRVDANPPPAEADGGLRDVDASSPI